MEGKKRRPVWEWLIFVAVLALAIFMVVSTYGYQQKIAKQHALHYQLQVLRAAELLYSTINNKLPEDLQQLSEESFRLPNDELGRPYIEHSPMLVGGRLIDPFGNPYTYDRQSGWIRSSTPGYEFW